MRLSALSTLSAAAALAAGLVISPQSEISARKWVPSKWTPCNVGEGYRGVCGRFIYPSEFGVALSPEDFQPALCNRIVSLRLGDKHVWSQILDICPTCGKGDLNITERLFKYFSDDLSTPLMGEWEIAGN